MNIDTRPRAVIFGAGVTGLTVAHELAVRGFAVRVFEKLQDSTAPEPTPQVGGLARTQWARVPQPRELKAPGSETIRATPVVVIPERLTFEAGQDKLTEDQIKRVKQAGARIKETTRVGKIEYGEKAGVLDRIQILATTYDELESLARTRCELVRRILLEYEIDEARIELLPLGDATCDDRFLSEDERRALWFEVPEMRLPGEHGYRFFPSFYWHLFDTMKRTPLLETQRRTDLHVAKTKAEVNEHVTKLLAAKNSGGEPPKVRVRRLNEAEDGTAVRAGALTAFDNLRSLPQHALAYEHAKQPPIVLDRQRPRSFEAVRRLIDVSLRFLGCTLDDIGLFTLKIFQYMTSCEARREAHGEGSWLDFLDIGRFSESFQKAIDRWPKALIALSASECDARTHGDITVQLLLDLLRGGADEGGPERPAAFTDGALVGPTSEAWLDPWRQYLTRMLNVAFKKGEIEKIKYADGKLSVTGPGIQTGDKDYLVLCTPVESLRDILDESVLAAADWEPRPSADGAAQPSDLRRAATLLERPWQNDHAPTGMLRNFAGVQFFLEQDLFWVHGHTYFPSSPWGISSVSQASLRHAQPGWKEGYGGIVSVDIGIMDEPRKPTPWECTAHRFAHEVWNQLKVGVEIRVDKEHGATVPALVPRPIYYHVDQNLEFAEGNGVLEGNRAPFLIPLVNTWDRRPGEPRRSGRRPGYQVHFGRLVLAGTYMKTFTRLTTMESANESGRHAVNAILWHRGQQLLAADGQGDGSGTEVNPSPGSPCDIFPLEDRELPDLAFLKELDQELIDRGLPHFVEILGVDDLRSASAVEAIVTRVTAMTGALGRR